MNNKLLTTRQFADMCRVEKRTLFYYDEIGLLKPAQVTESGYRYYRSEQFDIMSMIKAMQSVGMTLKEIKELMNETELPQCQRILQNQLELIIEKQKELRLAQHFLKYTMEELERYNSRQKGALFIEESPELALITEDVDQSKDIFINYLTNGYHNGVIIEDFIGTLPKLVYKKAAHLRQSNAIRAAGTYACQYESAGNGQVMQTIHNFVRMVSEQQFNTFGPIYMEEVAGDFIRLPNEECLFLFSIAIQTDKVM